MTQVPRRNSDGWFDIPGSVALRPRKTKNSEIYKCPQCGDTVELKYKVWLRTQRQNRTGIERAFSVAVFPQCDNCRQVMKQVT